MRRLTLLILALLPLTAHARRESPDAPLTALVDRLPAKGAEVNLPPPDEVWRGIEQACRARSTVACALLERLMRPDHRWLPGATREAAVKAAAAPLEPKCAAGDLWACYRLGLLLDDAWGRPIDGERAFALYVKACDGGILPACERVAVFYEVSVPSKAPDAKAKRAAALGEACDGGLPAACFDLGRGADEGEARRRAERACRGGHVSACARAISSVKARFEPAFACDQCAPDSMYVPCGDCEAHACWRAHCEPELSNHACCADKPQGTPPPAKTIPLTPEQIAERDRLLAHWAERGERHLERACSMGFVRGCYELGLWLRVKDRPTYDEARAREAFERGCLRGHVLSCLEGARLAEGDEARALWRKRVDDSRAAAKAIGLAPCGQR